MKGSKRCEVIVRFANYRVGEFIYPPAMHRDQLVRDGFVRIVEDDSALPVPRAIETATAVTPENTAMPAPVKRGRGRPRKDSYAHPTN